MNIGPSRPITLRLVAALLVLGSAGVPAADLADVDRQAQARVQQNQAAERQVTEVAGQTRSMELEYRQLLAELDQVQQYNTLLQTQVDSQSAELADIQASIESSAGLEKRLLPLVTDMIDGLDRFVGLDRPFLLDERKARVDALRASLEDPGDALAATLRKVFAAYDAEADYGRTLETYRDRIALGDGEREVEILRFGRVALLYRSLDHQALGAWNPDSAQWQPLDAGVWDRRFENALRVARKQTAPDLLAMPVFNIEEGE
ncbi:DUF3450 domain-containing protein [Marinobacter sp. JSM 1782161]|uniref:DUF3450 domain-containing protein n=1 Tax=Marinobacter sp. JSM 1782161 TaxID=2685906 RepID=UPI0014030534|nr:DUF3450 domain-containing protein [Marinobacter sp. JSM 1782161]